MEITFELENSDIVVDFEPDFRVQTNTTDQTAVSWRLSNRRTARDVVVLCEEFSDEVSINPTTPGRKDV